MTKLAKTSPFKAIIAAALEAKAMSFHSRTAATAQYERTVEAIKHAYASATTVTEIRATRAHSLDDLLHGLGHHRVNGDIDFLAAYEKFSIFKNPNLPIAVTNLRLASGRHNVSDSLTQEQLDLHLRMFMAFRDSEGDYDDSWEKKFNKLGIFLFSNMEHAHEIMSIVEQRQLLDPKDITAVFSSETKSALMEGAL